jgi:hypothetical protein
VSDSSSLGVLWDYIYGRNRVRRGFGQVADPQPVSPPIRAPHPLQASYSQVWGYSESHALTVFSHISRVVVVITLLYTIVIVVIFLILTLMYSLIIPVDLLKSCFV